MPKRKRRIVHIRPWLALWWRDRTACGANAQKVETVPRREVPYFAFMGGLCKRCVIHLNQEED